MALVTSIVDSEPSNYEEAASQQVWREAMMEQYSYIMKNDVWELFLRRKGKSIVTSKWLYFQLLKHVVDGSIQKFKAQFLARGFSKIEGIDYEETFTSIAQHTSIHSIKSIAADMG